MNNTKNKSIEKEKHTAKALGLADYVMETYYFMNNEHVYEYVQSMDEQALANLGIEKAAA